MNNRWEIGTLARQGDVLIRRIDGLAEEKGRSARQRCSGLWRSHWPLASS